MPRGVDRLDPRQAEVPDQVGLEERRDEAAARRVNVDRDVEARARLEVVEASLISAIGSYSPVKVEPRTPTTPIVFSSQAFTASSAFSA